MKPILEQIKIQEHQSISAFHHAKVDFETPWHFHPQHELTYIEESVGTKFIGDYVGSYEPGELVLLRSNLPHCWKNYSQVNTLSRSTVIQWNKGIFAKVPELDSVFKMLRLASRGIIFDNHEIKSFIPQILQLPKFTGHILYLQLLSLLVQLASCNHSLLSEASFMDDIPTEYNSRMAKIHDFIGIHFHEKIRLKEFADLVNMSEQSFSRFFSKMMGRPFFTFLNEYRVNMASRMLIDTDKSVAEIGYACGYESLPFFHKQFKKYKSISPSKYRNRYTRQVSG